MTQNKKIACITLGGYDGTRTLIRELERRGFVCDIISSREYAQDDDCADFLQRLVTYDLIYFRILANKHYGSKLVAELEAMGKVVVNKSYVLERQLTQKNFQMEKVASADVLFPRFVSLPFSEISMEYIQSQFSLPVILKTAVGICGRTVFKIEDENDLRDIVLDPERLCIVQEYISYIKDMRVFTIQGKIVGVMERRPQEGDFKANISQGGTGYPVYEKSILEKLETLISKLHPLFNVEIAGYDFLEDGDGEIFFLEINRNPGWKGLNKALNISMEQKIADYFEVLL